MGCALVGIVKCKALKGFALYMHPPPSELIFKFVF